MKLTIIGCTGSFPGPDSPASSYLLEAPHAGDTYRLVLDLGNGALGSLQQYADLCDIDAIVLSHLHADHCLDMCGFYVARKYHPGGPMGPIPVHGPTGTADYLARAYGLSEQPGMTAEFDFAEWEPSRTVRLGPFEITPILVDHPIEAYALKVTAGGKTLIYSGDTGPTEVLTSLVLGVDAFLCEASFVESADNPPNLHLTGAEAGTYAASGGVGQLLLTHIPPWTDRMEVAADARSTFDGPTSLVASGEVYEI